MIDIKNMYFDYADKNILHDINLHIKNGELIAIMGVNGSGKSTLAQLLNCLLKKKSGVIITDNLNYDDEKNIFKIRAKIGMVFQNPDNQIVSSIVDEEIAFGPQNLNLNDIEIRVENALKIVGMEQYKNSSIDMLSGGQKQKIAVASILAINPDYIIFDESTSMIDSKDEFLNEVIKLNKNYGKTILFITHDVEETTKFDRIIVLSKGKIIFDDTPQNIFCSENTTMYDFPFTIKFINELKKYGIEIEKTLSLQKLADTLVNLIIVK